MNTQNQLNKNQPKEKQPQKPYQDKIIPDEDRTPEVKEPYTTDRLERIASAGISSQEEGTKSSQPKNLVKPEAPASGRA